MYQVSRALSTFFDGIKDVLPAMIRNLSGVTRGVNVGALTGIGRALVEIFRAISSAVEATKTLGTTGTGDAARFDPSRMQESLYDIKSLFYSSDTDTGAGRGHITIGQILTAAANDLNGASIPNLTMIRNVKDIMPLLGEAVHSLTEIHPTTGTVVKDIADMFINTTTDHATIGTMLEAIGNDLGDLDSRSYVHIVTAVQEMIHKTNELTTELSHLEPITIATGLKVLAHNLGLGQTNQFEIQNRHFDIKVSFDIHMDVKDVEKILIDRRNSGFVANRS
jgi:hypothetical protein